MEKVGSVAAGVWGIVGLCGGIPVRGAAVARGRVSLREGMGSTVSIVVVGPPAPSGRVVRRSRKHRRAALMGAWSVPAGDSKGGG
ncbi:MAG: hypothetical protein DHS20C14_00160 [Phycisphaeraceae bacterium]|nr:MAG: hypothetical protein DHS20C14_00160 [Phycisphaeraceae bacterium]